VPVSIEAITPARSASAFYTVQDLEVRLGEAIWEMLAGGGPLDASDWIAAGAMTSRRQFPEQLLAQRD